MKDRFNYGAAEDIFSEAEGLTEIQFAFPEEVDGFVENLAYVLSGLSDAETSPVGFRTVLGNLKGEASASVFLSNQARKHGFYGRLRDFTVTAEPSDRMSLPRGLRELPDERIQSLAITAEMHSTGRGFIGYEKMITTLYVPPEGFFRRRYGRTYGTRYTQFMDCGEPLVLIAARAQKADEAKAAINLLNSGSEQISVWAERFALARTAHISSGNEKRSKVAYSLGKK